jgi:hypothetical protein
LPDKAQAGRSVAARRSGYVVALIVNGALLFLINAAPGWQAVPFLTPATRQVLGLVNVVLVLNLVVNIIYLAYDGPWLRAFGDIATTAVGLAAAIRILEVFPFAFHGSASFWSTVIRILLILAVVGGSIGLLVQVIRLIVLAVRGGRSSRR